MPARITVQTEGIEETLDSLRGLSKDLRKEANSEIRAAARETAEELAAALRGAASSSGVPLGPRISAAIAVKSDRFPTVAIGGNKRVGRRGGRASALVWGTEHGGRNFGVPESSGYWIAPTVTRFEQSRAVPNFKRALFLIVKRYGLEP